MFRSLAIALMLCAGAAGATPGVDTLASRSQLKARAVVDKAIAAIGGASALEDMQTVKLQLQGETWTRLQMPTPEPPFEPGRFSESLVLDLKDNRLYLEQQVTGAGFQTHNTVVIKEGQGTAYDHRARTATPIPAEQTSQQQFVQYYRRLPNLILRQALDNANSLRYLGEDMVDGRRQQVVSFVMPDTQQVALYIDAQTSLVSKYELVFTDPLRGQQASEILFSNYASAGDLRIPQAWSWRFAGDIVARYKVNAEFNAPDAARSFDFVADGYAQVAPLPLVQKPMVEKLAQGVFVIHHVAGQNLNTMAIEFSDHVFVVEAPGSSDGADAVIKRIKEAIPGKPIRYVAVTHHHGDHIGGLRSFIAEGATIVTTRGNRRTLELMAAAPQNDRLAKQPRKPEFAFVESGRRTFSDGQRSVELIDVGPNPHARELLIAYLPKERIVFQGDLFFMPYVDAPLGPPQDSTIAFVRKVKEKGLVIDQIAGVHGRTASGAEFQRIAGEATAQN